MSKPMVAVVGRPNVGKSTLFNRLVGKRLAITHEVPGTTRDRLYAEAEWGGVSFILVDTGGLEVETSKLMTQVRAQAQIAIAEADVILFLVDVKDGLTAGDEEVAQVLRRTAKPVLLAVNKGRQPGPSRGSGRVLRPGPGRAVSRLGPARHGHRATCWTRW